jgi:hypothetical protein
MLRVPRHPLQRGHRALVVLRTGPVGGQAAFHGLLEELVEVRHPPADRPLLRHAGDGGSRRTRWRTVVPTR